MWILCLHDILQSHMTECYLQSRDPWEKENTFTCGIAFWQKVGSHCLFHVSPWEDEDRTLYFMMWPYIVNITYHNITIYCISLEGSQSKCAHQLLIFFSINRVSINTVDGMFLKAASLLEWGKLSSWHNLLLWSFWVTSGLTKNLQIWIPVLIKWQRLESIMGVIFLILLCSWTYQIWKIPLDAMKYENRKNGWNSVDFSIQWEKVRMHNQEKEHRADLQDQFSSASAYGGHFTLKPQKRPMLYFYWDLLD